MYFFDKNMTEEDLVKMLDFVGMTAIDQPPAYHAFTVKIKRDCGGLSSFGHGDTRRDAIENALGGQNLDWRSVREKMYDLDCKPIMRL